MGSYTRRLVLLLCLGMMPHQSAAFAVAQGSYTSNTSDNRNISVTPSFAIQALLIKSSLATQPVLAISGMGGDLTSDLANNTTWFANCIQSLGTGIFQVGTDPRCNNNTGATYHYLALGTDTRADLAFGTYTGNATDNRTITFTPTFMAGAVLITGNTNGHRVLRTEAMSGDVSCPLSGTNACGANNIQSLGNGMIQIGTNSTVNSNAITYAYLVIKSGAAAFAVSSFTGNATDNRTITFTPAFLPVFFLMDVSDGAPNSGGLRFGTQAGDVSTAGAGSEIADCIQSLGNGSVQVGTNASCNDNTAVMYWMALGVPPVLTTRKRRAPLWLD